MSIKRVKLTKTQVQMQNYLEIWLMVEPNLICCHDIHNLHLMSYHVSLLTLHLQGRQQGCCFLHVFANCSRQKIAIRSKYSHLLNIYRQGGMAQHLIRCKVAAASEIITSTIQSPESIYQITGLLSSALLISQHLAVCCACACRQCWMLRCFDAQ